MTRFVICALVSFLLAACGAGVATQPQEQATRLSTSGGSAHCQINAIRAAAGRLAPTRNATLDSAARAHAHDMASRGFFSHKGSNGAGVGQRVTGAGYRWCTVSENISQGYPNAAAAVEGWRISAGHYRNMVSGKNKEYGLANVGDVWVMVMAASKC